MKRLLLFALLCAPAFALPPRWGSNPTAILAEFDRSVEPEFKRGYLVGLGAADDDAKVLFNEAALYRILHDEQGLGVGHDGTEVADFWTRLRQRGLNLETLAPYIAKLEAAGLTDVASKVTALCRNNATLLKRREAMIAEVQKAYCEYRAEHGLAVDAPHVIQPYSELARGYSLWLEGRAFVETNGKKQSADEVEKAFRAILVEKWALSTASKWLLGILSGWFLVALGYAVVSLPSRLAFARELPHRWPILIGNLSSAVLLPFWGLGVVMWVPLLCLAVWPADGAVAMSGSVFYARWRESRFWILMPLVLAVIWGVCVGSAWGLNWLEATFAPSWWLNWRLSFAHTETVFGQIVGWLVAGGLAYALFGDVIRWVFVRRRGSTQAG